MSFHDHLCSSITEVVKLNQIGIELYHLNKHLAASFHFNEALNLLRKIAAERDALEEQNGSQHRDTTSNNIRTVESMSLPTPNKVDLRLRRSLLQPLVLDPTLSSTQPEDWDRVYALTILHNIALTHYAINSYDKTERVLRLALRLLNKEHHHRNRHCQTNNSAPSETTAADRTREEEGEEEEYCRNNYSDEEEDDDQPPQPDFYSHVDSSTCVIIMSIYHMLGTVLSLMSGRTIKEILECYIEAIYVSREQLGGHVLVASVFISMGRVLVREGYIQEASYAYDMAKYIYCSLQAENEMEDDLLDVGCPGAPAA